MRQLIIKDLEAPDSVIGTDWDIIDSSELTDDEYMDIIAQCMFASKNPEFPNLYKLGETTYQIEQMYTFWNGVDEGLGIELKVRRI